MIHFRCRTCCSRTHMRKTAAFGAIAVPRDHGVESAPSVLQQLRRSMLLSVCCG